ncbi:MAG: hypothetical protein AAFN27_15015 [Pseudomonadota bacterium]
MQVTLEMQSGARHVGEALDAADFGANFLFNRVSFSEGVGDAGGFDEVAEQLGVTHLRYPGGTMTEDQFSLTDPEATFQATNLTTGAPIENAARHDLTPMSEFLAYAAEAGAMVTIVLPSARYQGNPARAAAEVEAFVSDVLSGPYGHVVEAFELGNEWSTYFSSASAYGAVANAMAVAAAAGAEGTGFDPMIAIQPSARAARLNETADIVAQLSGDALAAIDAVVIHNYRSDPWAERSITIEKFEHVDLFEAAAGRELGVVLSEWNVGNRSANDGLLQGAGLLEMVHQHAIQGADLSHVWPVLENNTTRLAGNIDDPDAGADLMIGGEVFRQMVQSLEGTQVLNFAVDQDTDGDGVTDLLVYGYEDVGRMVVFAASLDGLARDVVLDLGDLADIDAAFEHLWITELTVGEGVDPTDHKAAPVVHQVAAHGGQQVALTLDAYQVTRLEFASAVSAVVQVETAQRDDLRGTVAHEVFVLADDGERDLVREFDVAVDRLDVSSFGARSVDDLVITDLVRKDGSVSWVSIGDTTGQSEAILRFADGAPSAAALTAQNFIFTCPDNAMAAVPGMVERQGTSALDDLRGTEEAEIFAMTDDDVRDLVRNFADGEDMIDLSAIATGMEDLTIRDLVRKNGTVSWVEIVDGDGDRELIVRFEDGDHRADRLTEADFIF